MDFTLPAVLFGVGLLCFVLRALPRIGKTLIGHDAWAILTVPLKNLTQEYAMNFVLAVRKIVIADAIELPEFKQVMERNDYVLLERTT